MNYRLEIINKARQIWELNPIFLDTETTGLGERAEIVEISVVDSEGIRLIETLVRPRSPIPPDAVQLHGISNEQVAGVRSWLQVWPDIEVLLKGRYVGIYNAEFDLRMMQQSHRANGLTWKPPGAQIFDIMKMYTDFAGHTKWQKLEIAARQCGLVTSQAHRAYQDTLLARGVFMFMTGGNPS